MVNLLLFKHTGLNVDRTKQEMTPKLTNTPAHTHQYPVCPRAHNSEVCGLISTKMKITPTSTLDVDQTHKNSLHSVENVWHNQPINQPPNHAVTPAHFKLRELSILQSCCRYDLHHCFLHAALCPRHAYTCIPSDRGIQIRVWKQKQQKGPQQ